MRYRSLLAAALSIAPLAAHAAAGSILFVTQVPVADTDDVARGTVTSSFANHLPTTAAAPRGGDLMLRDAATGTLRNLTQEANFGVGPGFQGATSIAVRDPAVSFDGTRAVFSMVVGAPTVAGGPENYFWQLYEVTNLSGAAPAQIVKVANQPANFNNFGPNYLSDGTIVFVSDRPRNGAMHLYPINDEYRGQATNSGLWRLDPASGSLTLLEHTPSGSFSPFVDSFGRLQFVRWDHLMRDNNITTNANVLGGYDFADESAGAAKNPNAVDVFPEPINAVAGSNVNGYEINQFFPWTTNQDGTREELLNHLGRHELRLGVNITFTNDPNLTALSRSSAAWIQNFFQYREDPTHPGTMIGIDGPEFGTHTSGQLVSIAAPPSTNPATIAPVYLSNKATSFTSVGGANIGHFRDPLPMSDGTLVASFANTPGVEASGGTANAPTSNYNFRLYATMRNGNNDVVPQATPLITNQITKSVSYFVTGNNNPVVQNAPLWELQPVEVKARAVPPNSAQPASLATPEQNAFTTAGVDPNAMLSFLNANNLALVVIRNITSRDAADKQQPYNLRVPGGTAQTLGTPTGAIYDLDRFQFFQSDQTRGFGTVANPLPGRRVAARPLNDPVALANNSTTGAGNLPGSRKVFSDGSVATFVPAQRALTWQSISAGGSLPADAPVVRERYWIEFQKGEIRSCDSCHGINQLNQGGNPSPTNTPLALIDLLTFWKQQQQAGPLFTDGFE